MNLKLKHKRLYALLVVLCLVLSVAVLLTACKKDKGDDDTDNNTGNNETTNNPTYQGGAEQGTYYYSVAGGEQTLVLTAGNFTYSGTGFNKTGTYTVDGNNMVLTFADTADGTATATIASDKLTLTYKNATMTFFKNITYTVSFEANGGSAVAPITVVNGKSATKPQDPAKAGYAFLGWYTDSALTTSYAFTTPVTANVTLYAKWLEIADSHVYNVSFDLGYAGAPVISDTIAVDGTVYSLPADPTRDGYTFAGWWISMFEDGAKLSYEYTSATKLASDTTFFALWDSNSASIKTPEVNVSANGITWTPVSGANNYRVTLKDANGETIRTATTVGSNFNFNFSVNAIGAYIFEVVAEASGGKTSEVAVRYYNNKALDRVSELKIVDGKLVFGSVANAEKYILTIDCGNKLHNHDALDNSNSTYFDFSNCTMQAGGIKFSVVAAAEGYANSIPSVVLVHEQSLASAGTVTYDSATDSFVWGAVANASAYKVTLTVGTETYTFKTTGTTFSLADYTGSVSVSVTPVADGYNSPEASTAAATKTAPAKVQGLALNGTVLTWTSEVGNYVVTINGTEYTVTEATLDLAAKLTELNLTAGEEYTVTVVATANGESSAPATLTTIYNAMSTTLTYSDKVVSWPSVIGYRNFKVRVNGGEEITVTGKNFANVVLNKAGENVIEVICTDITTDWTNAAKITVTAYAVKYATRSDAGEFVEYLAAGDTLTPPTGMTLGGFTFGGWYNTPLAADDNGKEYTETKFFGNADLTLYANWTPNKYTLTLNVNNGFISSPVNGTKVEVTYTKDFTLPVPVSTDESKGFFAGWYTAENGKGVQLTDASGNSVAPYSVIGDAAIYPFFAAALSYDAVKDDNGDIIGYYANKGPAINNKNVTELTIPATYDNKPIIGIVDNAFHSCTNLVTVNFPDTVMYVGQGAFELCSKLVAINMYDADPMIESDTPYSTFDGALMYERETDGNIYLEIFPSAKTGEYTTSDNVTVIGPGAFKNAKISKIIISKGVNTVSKNAFSGCTRLTEIEFMYERDNSVYIEDGAFVDTPNVIAIKLPAKLAELENIKVFDAFEDLATIEIEGGGDLYRSVNNLICDPFGTKLLYVPRSYRGTFEVPSQIHYVGDKLFLNNPYITKVVIGEQVVTIGSDAFRGCSALTEVVVKAPRESIFTISANAFYQCTNLKTFVIEGSEINNADMNCPIYISENAFAYCSKLQSVTIGKNATVHEISTGAFSFCTSLTTFSVDDEATLDRIGDSVFKGCTGLTKFVIHGTTSYIGNSAFENCSMLNTISLGNGAGNLTFGDTDVFKNCVRLTTIELPASLTSFNSTLFDGCENIQNIIVDPANTYLSSKGGALYTADGSELIYYPRTKTIENGILDLTDSSLKKIGSSVFKNNPNVKVVKIGASVEVIADHAFENCINLTSVQFVGENAQLSLGAYAFSKCAQLQSITLPAATEVIGGYAFDHTGLTEFTLPAGATYIAYGAFAYTNLTSITIPASVTFIGQAAFYNVTGLETVIFEARTEALEIGQWDEDYGKDHAIVYEPQNGVFSGTKISEIDLPATVTYVGDYAFYNLTTLETLSIPETAALATIGSYAFANTSLTSVTFNEGLTTIGSYAFANTKLTGVNIPASVQYIETYAFSIPTLTAVTFVEGSSEGIGLHIKNYAFVGADLTAIHLPAQLKAFGESVDKYGYSAINVFYDFIPTQSYQTFKGNLNLKTITVSEDNIVFASIDGVLYRLQGVTDPATGTTSYRPVKLLFSPKENLGSEGTVTVPNTVTLVDYASFLQTKLTKIIFEEFDKENSNYGTGKLAIGTVDSSDAQNTCPPVISNAVTFTYDANGNVTNTKSYTNLELIQLPSHVSAIRNKFIDGLNILSGETAKLVINFNPDADVKLIAFAFRNSSAIKTINLPKLNWVGRYSVNGLTNLTELTIAPGSTVTSIGEFAFATNGKLTSFVLPASVKTIEKQAFASCTSLSSFSVEDGSVLEMIGDNAFQQIGARSENGVFTHEVAYFKIPDTVTAIGLTVFKNARILEIEISKSLTDFGALLEGCSTVSKIHVPETHPTLSSFDGVVYNKNKTGIYLIPSQWDVQTYEIPDTVQYIEAGTFANFKGTYIKLPAALTEISYRAFQYSNITHIEIPANVVSIGADAFYYCENLKTITIPNDSQLKYIGYRAFSHTAITEINLPDSVEEMGYSTFEACYSLVSVKLPASLKTLESRVFNNCSSLVSVELNLGLETIKNSAFAGSNTHSNKITEIYIPASVNMIEAYVFNKCLSLKTFICDEAAALNFIGNNCFNDCSALETVKFGAAVKNFGYTQLGYNTFAGCNSLKTITLPAEMTEIPDGFLKNLPKLQTVVLSDIIETIGAEAFLNCPELTEITIPKTIKKIGNSAFAKCTTLASVEFEEGSAITEIPTNAFAECIALASINLPDSIITIGATAFAMTAFTEFTLPASLETIGDTAFYGCPNLTALKLPASVTSIGAKAFANCPELAVVNFNSVLTTIDSYAFANCKKLTNVELPASLTTLTDNPFIGCANLNLSLAAGNTNFKYENGVLLDETGLTIIYYSSALTATEFALPETVVYIAGGAFANSQLVTIFINDINRITDIPDYAFMDSASLKNVVIPNTVTRIGSYAFSGCASIETITIPYSVLSIGDYAFAECVSLANFTLADRKDNMTVGSHLFYGCSSITKTYDFPGVNYYTPYMYAGTGITSLVLPDYIIELDVEGVFANSALESVSIPNNPNFKHTKYNPDGSVRSVHYNYVYIGKNFFAGTNLTNVTLPSVVQEIGESAFANCVNLVSVTMSSRNIYVSAFEGCTALTTFTVEKPASDPQFQLVVDDRAFANASSLSNTNIFEFAYSYGVEAFLNASSLTGEISLYSRLGLIENYAFSGTNLSKITVNGSEYNFYDYSLAGLTEATTVYFASVNSLEALLERMGGNSAWVDNTAATLEFYKPSSGKVEVTLTPDEEKWLNEKVEKGQIDRGMMDKFKEAWLAYKGSFVTLYPSKELSKDDIRALDEFANSLKLDGGFKSELEKLWVEYRMTLAKELINHPQYFTEVEMKSFNELAEKMDENTKKAFQQAWFEYKISFNETNPSKELSEEERKNLEVFCKTNGLDEQMMKNLMEKWPEYKMQLAASLVKPVRIDLTESELKALEMFCKNYDEKFGLSKFLEDIKTAWMEYKGALVMDGKGAAEALTPEEEALVKSMVDTYGLGEDLMKELSKKLLQYKQEYAGYFTKFIPLNDQDKEMIKKLVDAGLAESDLEKVEADLLAYKKSFCLSGFVPSKELSDAERTSLIDFFAKYGLKAELADKYAESFMNYRLEFASSMGREIKK